MVASDIKFDILYTGWSEKSGTLGNGCKTINLLLKYLIITDHNTRSWEHLLVKNLRNQMNRTRFMNTNVTNLLFTKFPPDGGHRAGDRRQDVFWSCQLRAHTAEVELHGSLPQRETGKDLCNSFGSMNASLTTLEDVLTFASSAVVVKLSSFCEKYSSFVMFKLIKRVLFI